MLPGNPISAGLGYESVLTQPYSQLACSTVLGDRPPEKILEGRTVSFIGGGIESIPGIRHAQALGAKTLTLDGDPRCPGAQFSTSFAEVEISRPDQVAEFFADLRQDLRPNAVTSLGTDFPQSVAAANEVLGTKGLTNDVIAKCSDKWLQKILLSRGGVPTPKGKLVKSELDIADFLSHHHLGVVVKPIDSRGARGVTIVRDNSEIENALQSAFQNTAREHILVEEFMEGDQYSSEGIVQNGTAGIDGLSLRNYDRLPDYYPHIIEDGGNLSPEHSEGLSRQIETLHQKIAALSGLENGSIKGDIVIHNGTAKVIEFALRPSGGFFSSHQIPAATGFDFLGNLFSNLCGGEVDYSHVRESVYVTQRFVFPGDIATSNNHQDFSEFKDNLVGFLVANPKPGVGARRVANHTQRLGNIITWGKSLEEANRSCASAKRWILAS